MRFPIIYYRMETTDGGPYYFYKKYVSFHRQDCRQTGPIRFAKKTCLILCTSVFPNTCSWELKECNKTKTQRKLASRGE